MFQITLTHTHIYIYLLADGHCASTENCCLLARAAVKCVIKITRATARSSAANCSTRTKINYSYNIYKINNNKRKK